MLNLFDMLNQAQNGQGMDMLARQFNLSRQQADLAVEALLPAFSQGLKRNTSDPYGLGGFLNAMASGQHAKYFEDASRAFSPQGVDEGNGILGHLFGSKDLSRAVAAQAAQATGIGQQLLQQMLPVIASMVMGGLFKQSTNQMQAGGFGGGNNPLGQIIEEMMKQSGGLGGGQAAPQRRAPQPSQQPDNPFGNNPLGDTPFGKVLQDMFGGGAQQMPQGRTQQPQNPLGDNPWGKVLQDMFGGSQQEHAEPQRRAPSEPEAKKNPYDDIFGQMFETGRQQRDDYQKGVESVFDQFLRGMDRNR
ncbi:hypothetical protein ASD50_07445 [Mesorhizobium sp. Root552]|uniref:DUF937 domain-containing protein n=1 Tax=Mesorhizobium sp. Root552 TaxID=1736555 RepID=UPI0006F35CDE|nr:DUF937 domain-containing protein [Mesorhizobium sp. Root552]KQZ19315.1 hypothetical protein ASD50_07445 [Mesorhizobium sp. Root552]